MCHITMEGKHRRGDRSGTEKHIVPKNIAPKMALFNEPPPSKNLSKMLSYYELIQGLIHSLGQSPHGPTVSVSGTATVALY